jgi:hypothetical protein
LELDDRIPSTGEKIYIPQHPDGRDKEIAIFDSHLGTDERCEIQTRWQESCYGRRNTGYYDLSYSCDTEGGSSGSPVISTVTNKVVGLHHCGGGCNIGNVAVPMKYIIDDISGYIAASPQTSDPTSGPTVDPTSSPTVEYSDIPTITPTSSPTVGDSSNPTLTSSSIPTVAPTSSPTVEDSSHPTDTPTSSPTVEDSSHPTGTPTSSPTVEDSSHPTGTPTSSPTVEDSSHPTGTPSSVPTVAPTKLIVLVADLKTSDPTSGPTVAPTSSPTVEDSDIPTVTPTTTFTFKGDGYCKGVNGQVYDQARATGMNSADECGARCLEVDATDFRGFAYKPSKQRCKCFYDNTSEVIATCDGSYFMRCKSGRDGTGPVTSTTSNKQNWECYGYDY